MAYLTYRVEITRDESRRSGAPSIEITAYIDRVPETNEPEFGRLSRAYKGVWNSRLQYTGDFESLSEALVAIETAYPEVEHIRCYEYSVDNEYPNEMPPLRRSGKNGRRVKLLSRAALRRNSLGRLVEPPNGRRCLLGQNRDDGFRRHGKPSEYWGEGTIVVATSSASSSARGPGRRSGLNCRWRCASGWAARPAPRLRFSTAHR